MAPLLTALAIASPAQTPQTPQNPPVPDAQALVKRAVQHHIDADASHHPVRYLLRRVDARRDTTKDIVETKDGDVARLVAIDGKPLSAADERGELDRLNNLLQHPEMQERRHKAEQKDAARVDHLMRQLPEAFLYQVIGTTPCGGAVCYRLSFKPNPKWSPPDLESGVFRGVSGEAWIDQAQERLTRIDARFISDVDFGFGILGKLNKGSTAVLEQTDVGTAGNHDWELTLLKLNVTGKALLVKSLSFRVTEEASHFTQVAPNLTYNDAIHLLENAVSAER